MPILEVRQLSMRFGPLPDEVRARVQSATPPQLDIWVERVLTATTLDDVFSP